MKKSQTPVDLARMALLRLSDQGLPPTPENYTRLYREAEGVIAPPLIDEDPELVAATMEQAAEKDLELEEYQQRMFGMVRSLVDVLSSDAAILTEDIGLHNREMKQTLQNLSTQSEQQQLLRLLGCLVTTGTSLHQKVEESHTKLLDTQQALEQMKAELQESRLAMQQDPLTGASNRRGMEVTLTREIARAKRGGFALCVAMFDLDHFKQINDNYGHFAGDKVLIHVTEITRSVMRESDVLVRYGGEEFLMILGDTDINGGQFLLDRLKLVVKKTPFLYEGKPIELTFSAGLAQFKPEDNGHALIMRADAALYRAKHEGRDCVRVAD